MAVKRPRLRVGELLHELCLQCLVNVPRRYKAREALGNGRTVPGAQQLWPSSPQ